MKKPNIRFKQGAFIIDNQNEPAIIIDNNEESPIRLIRKNNLTTSVYAKDIFEVSLEIWKKAKILKIKSP